MATAAEFNADFSKFIGEFNKVEVKLTQFDQATATSVSSAAKLADALNGEKISKQAQVAVRAIQTIEGGVSALTRGELKRMGAIIDEATEKFHVMGRTVPADMAAVKASLDAARASTEQATAPAGGLMQMFTQGLGLGAGMSVFGLAEKALSAITGQLTAMWTEGQKLSALGTAFTNLSGGAAPAAAKIEAAREATRGLVSDLDLMQASNKASLLGLDKMGIKFDEMAGIAAKLGKAMGQDAAKSVDDLTTALSRQSPMILDNLGISVKLSDAYDSYAATLGKTAEALTEEEKKQAFATAAMDAAQQKVATLGDQTLTLGEQFTRLGNVLTNTRAEIGASANETSILADVLGGYTSVLADTIDNLGDAWSSFKDVNAMMAENVGVSDDVAKAWNDNLVPALVLIASPGTGLLNLAARGFAALTEQIQAAGMAQRGLLGIDNKTRTLQTNVPAPYQFSRPQGDRNALFATSAEEQAQSARSKKLLEDEIKARQKLHDDAQAKALKALEDGGEKTSKLVAKQHSEREKKEKEHQDRLAKLSGGDAVAAAIQASLDIKELKGKLGDDAAAKIFGELLDAKQIAKAIKPEAVAGIEEALQSLASNPGVVRQAREAGAKILKNIGAGLGSVKASDLAGSIKPGVFDSLILGAGAQGKGGILSHSALGVLGKSLGADITYAMQQVTGVDVLMPQNLVADTYALRKGLDGIGIPMQVIDEQFDNFIDKSQKWGDHIDKAAQAFGVLAQNIQGTSGTVDNITGGIGNILASASAGKEFGKALQGAGLNSSAAAVAGVGLAGFSSGAQLAAMTGTTSKGKGALAGAAGGAASGAMMMSWGGPMAMAGGAIVGGIAGAIGGMITAGKKAKEARALMEQNRKDLLAFYGSREELIHQAGRFGISENEVSKNILNNEKDVKKYQQTLTKLTDATEKEQKQAKALATDLGKVAAARGVLNKQQTTDLRDALKVGEGPRTEAAQAFLDTQTESLMTGLAGTLASGPLSPKLVAGVGEALPAAFAELKRSGLSTIDALRTMEPILSSFQQNVVAAGRGSTPGFDALNASLTILKDEKLGPLVQQADFASQSLAALQNLGYGSQAAFDGFSSSITDTFAALSEGAGAEQALALLQQPLQNAWQLAKDFGYETDEATAALLSQAEAAGVVGDKFRPAADRMAAALDTVVARLDELIGVFTGELVSESSKGAGEAGQAILDKFAQVHPIVRVEYEYSTPEVPDVNRAGGGAGTQAARIATDGGGDIYMDGERVGVVVGRHLGKVSDYAGA